MEITKKPFLVSFAGNPMRYLLTPGSGGGLQENSVIEIEFTGIDSTADHEMEVDFMGDTRTFILKATPSTRDHLPLADSGWSAARWCEECYNYLLNDRQITDNYLVEIDGAVITLTAKEADASFDMTMGTSNVNGVTVNTITAGSSGSTGDVEGVLCTVFKNGTEKIGEDYKPVDASGNVKFEVQEYIYASLLQAPSPRFHLVMTSGYYHIFNDFMMKYRSVFTNKIAGVFEERSYSDPYNVFCYALPGGLNREDLVENNRYNRDWFNLATTKKAWLTWSSPSRITDKVETHSLYFAFQSPAYTQFKLRANLYDGETGSQQDLTGLVAITPFSVYEFVAGYNQLDLSTYMNGNVNRWELYLVDNNGNTISDVREFILDEEYHENIRYFRFRNSWGAYDSFRCVGDFESSVGHDRERVSYSSDETETSYNAPGAYTMIKEAQSFKANSGWITRDYLNFLRDFMLSKDIYEVEDDRLLKCLLTSKKTALFRDRDYNYSLSFEYDRGYEDFFFQGLE